MKKPSYRKLKQMLEDAENAFRQVQSNNLKQGSEIVQLRETVNKLSNVQLREAVNKLSNDLEHKELEARVKELEAKLEAVRLVIR